MQSSDAQGNSVQQQFLITVSNTDPITPSVTISGSMPETSIAANQTGAGAAVGTLATTAAAGGIEGSQINYSLVSGPGSDNNNLFQIVNGQLETTGTLTAGTYTVRVRSTSTFLISDVVDLERRERAVCLPGHPRSDPTARAAASRSSPPMRA